MTTERTTMEVTQADRDGAVAYWIGLVSYAQLKAIRDGENDNHWKVKALARQRIATTAQTEAAAKDARIEALEGEVARLRDQIEADRNTFRDADIIDDPIGAACMLEAGLRNCDAALSDTQP